VSLTDAGPFLKQTYSQWSDHNAPRLGASVAFYSILSFAPLLVLITAIIGLFFGHESAHGALVNEARQVIGDRGADTVESLLKSADKPVSGTFASIIAFITLLFGASGVFTELHDALNIMWDAPKQESSGFLGLIKERLFSFGMVLVVGFLLLVSLLLSAGLAYLGHSFAQVLPLPPFVLQILSFCVSFVVIATLFALLFKYVPAVHVSWREVIVGALGTALLFTIGKFLLGIYLAKASVGSAYGAAGSLVAVVVWIYYSAQIFFFGAEFTRVYADADRPKAVPQRAGQAQPDVQDIPAIAQDVAWADQRKSVAAAAGASSSLLAASLPHAPGLYSERPSSPPAVISMPASVEPAAPMAEVANSEPGTEVKALRKPTKPRLLAAVGIGFLLGRITWGKLGTKSSKAYR
jgi:membrane protein